MHTKSWTRNKLLILFALLTYLFAGNMLAVYSTVLPYRDWLRLAFAVVGCTMLIVTLFNKIVSKKNILLLLFGFVLLTLPVTLYAHITTTSLSYSILQTGDSLAWVGVFSIAYWIGFESENAIWESRHSAYLIVLFSILFIGVKQFSAGRGIPLISTAYYSLFLLPFAFMIRNNSVKWILVLCAFSSVLLSVKRTGFIAIVIAVAVYLLVDYRVNSNGKDAKVNKIIGAITLLLALGAFFQYFTSNNDLSVLDRILSIAEDEGSGRSDVWKLTWEMIKQSNPLQLLIGHGFNMVYHHSPVELSAHNDFLEIIYDYGIIGFFLYLSFYKRLFKYYKIVREDMPDLAAPFAVSFVLAGCMSCFAHLIIYPTHFLFLCVFWGLIVGHYDSRYKLLKSRIWRTK